MHARRDAAPSTRPGNRRCVRGPQRLLDLDRERGGPILRHRRTRLQQAPALARLRRPPVSDQAQQLIAKSESWGYALRPGMKANPELQTLPGLTPAPLTSAEVADGKRALGPLQQVGLL